MNKTSARERYLDDLIARDQISRCITTVARGLDRYDEELAGSAYHPDATDDHGTVIGLASDYVAGRTPIWRGLQHFLMNQTIDLDGTTAHVETYFMAVIWRPAADGTEFTVGRYLDRMEQVDGEWRIAHRSTVVEWSGSMDAAPDDSVVGGVDGFLKGSHDRDDLSYVRPLTLTRPHTR